MDQTIYLTIYIGYRQPAVSLSIIVATLGPTLQYNKM